MKNIPFLKQLFPRRAYHYSKVPIVGIVLEDFAQWLHASSYAVYTRQHMLRDVRRVADWLKQRRHIGSITDLSADALQAAGVHFGRRRRSIGSVARTLLRFLLERGLIPETEPPPLSPAQLKIEQFTAYLRDVVGLAPNTICRHAYHAAQFLKYLGFDRAASKLAQLRHRQIEVFLQKAGRRHCRRSLLQVASCLRVFLRFEFAKGVLLQPLHEQVTSPLVYRDEELPRALPRQQVASLLRSIDRSTPTGLRDFTMLYLLAAYGLRRGELVRLRLEDIDWRNATLQVRQTKTKQVLKLPLTEEAGDWLVRYLREARPRTECRELFLRVQAPRRPLGPEAVYNVFQHRAQASGLELGKFGPHALRHSLAVHLLRRGVPPQSIGDTLGHRDVGSTGTYLRLAVEDLRAVGLPVPLQKRAVRLLPSSWPAEFPRMGRTGGIGFGLDLRFQSRFGATMERFVALRRALGRKDVCPERVLRGWDAFLWQHRAKAMDQGAFEGWSQGLIHLAPEVQRKRMCLVRRFLAYYAREHPEAFVPSLESFPKKSARRLPRLVSPREMACLLASAKRLQPANRYGSTNPLRAEALRLGLLLLYCCGLRRGELFGLQLQHYDSEERLLRVEATKFNKSRLVPLAPSVAKEVQSYLRQRRRLRLPTHPENALIWSGDRPEPKDGYSAHALTHAWRHLCLSAGVLDRRGRPPRLHDLRHSFAVNALHRWYRQGVDVQARSPHLSTYLGHRNLSSTHYYLHLNPALRSAASRRFQRVFGNFFSKGGAA